MRKKLLKCCCAKQARLLAPWAIVIHETDEGYWAFECKEDHFIWMNG